LVSYIKERPCDERSIKDRVKIFGLKRVEGGGRRE
jgi:hypothetical protein